MKNNNFPVLNAYSSASRHLESNPLGSIKIARGLSQLLILTQTLSRRSLYCHWQAMEPGALHLHSLFEQHFQSLRKAVDIIGDRIRTLGYEVPDEISKSSWMMDDSGSPLPDMIRLLILGHQACMREAHSIIEVAEEMGDDISANLAAQRSLAHENSAWLLLALIETKPANRSLI